MDIKEELISLKKELEAVKKDFFDKKEIEKQINLVKKKNKALLKSLIFMIVAFFVLLSYTYYINS